MAGEKIERKENFPMTIEVRALPGAPMPADPQGTRVDMAQTSVASSFTMNAFDVLDRLEKKPADLMEMLSASIVVPTLTSPIAVRMNATSQSRDAKRGRIR